MDRLKAAKYLIPWASFTHTVYNVAFNDDMDDVFVPYDAGFS